jgi:xanthine/CO dehydrogenase XdhC/CoxF family maturation factor/CTP:molybdopterin cytidylyltransferase MocA
MDIDLPALVTVYQSYRTQSKPLVLATLVETAGPAYRKPGARMLIDEDGNSHGLLGIGIEAEISARARQVFTDHEGFDWIYDSRSGMDWEAGQDRNCLLHILFEYITPADQHSSMAVIEKALSLGTGSVLATITESDIEELRPGAIAWIADGECRIPFPEQYLHEIRGSSRDVLGTGKPSLESFLTDSGSFNVLFEVIRPPFHLLIAGSGVDTVALLKLAKFSGWRVTMVDSRDDYINNQQYQAADRRLAGAPEQLRKQLDCRDIDAVVLMTHKFDYDLGYLKELAGTAIPYIGLLGPAAKRDKLLELLALEDSTLRERIYGPVGLDIGAELPQEVAISIIAEIKASASRRPAGFLSRQTAQQAVVQGTAECLYALVLAAGGSRRFGGLKQLVELQGRSLLRRAVESAMVVVDNRVLVILGVKAKTLERELRDYDVQIVENLNWENGIASSIRAGISALPEHCTGVLISFCDQPFVSSAHLQELIDAWNRDQTKIVSSSYHQTIGVPAIIPREYFAAMMKLTGDNGAKSIMQAHREHMLSIALPEAALDIDTQSDLVDAINRLSN